MRLLLSTLIIFFTLPLFAAPETYYLLRHAEKKDYLNPSLTEQGQIRANRIATFLSDKNISHIFSTNYNRTLETAKPLSEKLNITVTHYNPRQLSAFVKQLKTLKGNVVIVGHSNTTPDLVKLLSDKTISIKEDEFDKVFIIKDRKLTITNSN